MKAACPVALVLAAVGLLTSGCMHTRVSAFVSVEGPVRQIETRNRYRLVDFKYEAKHGEMDVAQENLHGTPFSAGRLKYFQPLVFDDAGIPFTVSSKRLTGTVSKYGWTIGLYVFSLATLPTLQTAGAGERLTIDVVDNPGARMEVDTQHRYDNAFTMLSPIPMLCFAGDAAPLYELENYAVISKHKIDTLFRASDSRVYRDAHDELVAYAVATLLKRMEDAGLIDETRVRMVRPRGDKMHDLADSLEIVAFRRDDNFLHRYSFTLRQKGGGDISLQRVSAFKKAVRGMVCDDFLFSFPNVPPASLVVDFPAWGLRGGEITGKAVVLSLAVDSLRYDHYTRRGTVRMRIGENQFEDARRYARKNIELIVRDKNIALSADVIPPAARFRILGESLKGNVLEMNFEAE